MFITPLRYLLLIEKNLNITFIIYSKTLKKILKFALVILLCFYFVLLLLFHIVHFISQETSLKSVKGLLMQNNDFI